MFRKRSAENSDVPIMVHRVIDDIDEIVRAVCLDGWQATHADESEVRKALRQVNKPTVCNAIELTQG